MRWKENFRVTREIFHFICTAVAPVIQHRDTTLGAAIPVETRTATGLWRLATGDSYHSCGLMFGISLLLLEYAKTLLKNSISLKKKLLNILLAPLK